MGDITRSIGDDVTLRDAVKSVAGRKHPGDEILARYVVQAELGQGGMGVVYKCLDKVGGVEVAVKGLPPDVSHNADEMEEIRENFQLVSDLRHPGIAGVRTLEKDSQGDYYLVMDIARGDNLNRWLRAHRGQTDLAECLSVLSEIAAALDYAHSRRVMHRDVKPENIMVDADGHVQVLDFGLAARIRTSLSRVSMMVTSKSGTPGYKSPEQWRGQAQGAAADQYALGVVAYRMISGGLPFDSDDLGILREAVLKEPMPEIPDVPSYVNKALARALAKTPAERFSCCSDFVAVLGGGKATGKPAAPSASKASAVAKPASAVRGIGLGILAAVVLAIAGVAVWRGQSPKAGLRSSPVAPVTSAETHDDVRPSAELVEEARIEASRAERQRNLRNAAIELKSLAGIAHKDAAGRGFEKYPELAQTLRLLNSSYEAGIESFANGDFVAATNFFERTGSAMRTLAEGQRRLDAMHAEQDRSASVARKVATGGYDVAKGADGKDTAVWVAHRVVNGRMTSDREGVWCVKAPCPACAGSKTIAREVPCVSCSGTGRSVVGARCTQCSGNGWTQAQQACPQCSRTGVVRTPCSAGCRQLTRNGRVLCQHGHLCSKCGGSGTVANPAALANAIVGIGMALGKRGKYRPQQQQQRISCPQCNGVGGYQCQTCGGTGVVQRQCTQCGGGGTLAQKFRCNACSGMGTCQQTVLCPQCKNGRVVANDTCERCRGTGQVWQEESGAGGR